MNLVKSSVETVVQTITPKMATELLKSSQKNRRIRWWWVDLLAGAMARGEWILTNQGIAISRDGCLLDGSHRLHACIKSGVPITMLVTYGLDPIAYEVIDTGIKRNVEDLLNIDKRVSSSLRLAAILVLSVSQPTSAQLRPFIQCGLYDGLKSLVEYCGTARKFYSSSAMKLAAVISIMRGEPSSFVMMQYRGLCLLDFNVISQSAHALIRQVNSKKVHSVSTREVLARGLKVFSYMRRDVTKIQVNNDEISHALQIVRNTLKNQIDFDVES